MSPNDWDGAAHGGCLRLYRPIDDDGRDGDEDDVLVDVAPVADRLVLFLSDLRCPHEVLAIQRSDGQERYSAITWYCEEPSAAPVGERRLGVKKSLRSHFYSRYSGFVPRPKGLSPSRRHAARCSSEPP